MKLNVENNYQIRHYVFLPCKMMKLNIKNNYLIIALFASCSRYSFSVFKFHSVVFQIFDSAWAEYE